MEEPEPEPELELKLQPEPCQPEPCQPEPELRLQSESSSDSEDDSDDFQSVQGDEQLMQDVDDVEGVMEGEAISHPGPQRQGSRHSDPSPVPAQVEVLGADLRQHQLDLEYRRRFLSLRPVFRDIFAKFGTLNGSGADVDGGMEPSTMEGLAKTLFPRSVPWKAPNSSADTPLVSWTEFTTFAESDEHVPRDDLEWEQLMEKLAMMHMSANVDGAPLDAASAVEPSSLAEAAEAAAVATWTTEPGLREEHVEALACPSPRAQPPADGLGHAAPRISACTKPQSCSDLTADEIVGGSIRPPVDDPQSADGAELVHSDIGTADLQTDTVGRVNSQVRKKDTRDLDRLVYCQRLAAHHGAVWAMRFSQDGRWLATGGQDTIVRIWRAQMWNKSNSESASPREAVRARLPHDVEVPRMSRCSSPEPGNGRLDENTLTRRRAFDPDPALELRGHQHDVLDLAWSRDNFLLSSSMDATVCLWHVSTPVCLRTYQHSDFVTSVMFNPADDTCFITGSLSGQLSLWHIPSHRVVAHRELQESITAAALNPDGGMVVVGTFEGKATFFRLDVEGSGSEVTGATLGHLSQLDLSVKHKKNRGTRTRGKGKHGGNKITGIAFRPGLSIANDTALGFNSDEVLISSNDDRVRLFTIRWPQQHGAASTISRQVKFSGHYNSTSQLRATFSWDGQFISSPSDDRHIYFWRVETDPTSKHPDHQKRWERWEASQSALTAILMAPPGSDLLTKVSPVPAAAHDTMGGDGVKGGSASTGAQSERPEMVLLTASFSGAVKVWAF